MVLSTAGIAINLYACGQKRSKYEENTHSILDELIQLRAQAVINYDEESKLIHSLATFESDNYNATQATVLDVGSKTVKVCAGPAAGFATKIVTGVAKKQNAGSDQSLLNDLSDSLAKEVTNEATKTACKKTAEWAVDWLGVAGMVGLMATPAAGIALGTAAVASLLIPSVREGAYDFVSSACKGTEAIISDTASKIFLGNNKNQKIINAYQKFETKKGKLEACVEEKSELDSELNNVTALRSKKIQALAHLIKEMQKEDKLLQDEKQSLSNLELQITFEEILKLEENELNDLNTKIKEIEDIIEQDQGTLAELSQQILLRKKNKLYRLVKHFNKPNFLYKFLTRLFSALFSKYKKEKKAQDSEATQKTQLEKNVAKQSSKVDRKKIKAQKKQEYIDTHPSSGDLEELKAEKLLKEDFIESQQLKVDSIKSKSSIKRQLINDQLLKVGELTQEIDDLATKVLKKTAKLDTYESNYVDMLIQT